MATDRIFIVLAGAFAAASAMSAVVSVDFASDCGPVKPMNAVNNKAFGDVRHGNFAEFRAARIPYGRTHSASESVANGGDHLVDVTAVFPDFDADENDPKNFDFADTDNYLRGMRRSGAEPFYRLGQRVERTTRRYNVYPPKDFAKWARICEGIIRHYNSGWANGFSWKIRHWEIWNEPDADVERRKRGEPPQAWGGTREEFFRFYETAAKHLKGRFPELAIGGPAVSGGDLGWCEAFLKYQHGHKAPLDFFSWHCYVREPAEIVARAKRFREMLDRCGYAASASILDEWNYLKGWGESYHQSIVTLASPKGAAFAAAAMIACQKAPVDMLMYSDARMDADFNGLFDKVSMRPLAPYYAFYAWGRFSTCPRVVKASSDVPDIYAVAARGADRRRAVLVARYSDDNNIYSALQVAIRLSNCLFPPEVSVHMTDETRRHTELKTSPDSASGLHLMMDPHSFALVEFDEPALPLDKSFAWRRADGSMAER